MRPLATMLLVLGCGLHGAVVIDRIAVIVGKHAVKSSDIQRDLLITEFLNREPLDLSPARQRESAKRLIDQAVIRDQIAQGGYRRPSDSDAQRLLQQLVRDRYAGSGNRLREALSRYGLTEDQLRRQLLWQLTVLSFIDQRFRPGVQVADEDVREYYDRNLAELKRDFPNQYSFAALQARIRDTVQGQRVNEAFTSWLDEARRRVRVEYREGAFQ